MNKYSQHDNQLTMIKKKKRKFRFKYNELVKIIGRNIKIL